MGVPTDMGWNGELPVPQPAVVGAKVADIGEGVQVASEPHVVGVEISRDGLSVWVFHPLVEQGKCSHAHHLRGHPDGQ